MESNHRASILVVDDLEENVILIQKFLEREGHEIRCARSGKEALELIERRPPDLILLDVMMPGMDGIEVCQRIKAMPNLYLPVVLVTAFGASEIKRRGIDAGAEDFISKPFDPEELIARVRSLLKTRELYDALFRANARMEHEIKEVGDLAKSLLPDGDPKIDGLRLNNLYLPSRMAGGDYYDYVPLGGRRLGIALGDASGHGPHAAVLMAMTKVALHLCRECSDRPAALLDEAARHLAAIVPEGQFITLFYGVIDLDKGTLTGSTAGHCPPVLVRKGSRPEMLEIPPGLPLGLYDERPFDQRRFEFHPGDRLILYTDGIIEAHRGDMALFGMDRFMDLVAEFASMDGGDLAQALVERVFAFTGAKDFNDDCTLLIADCEDGGPTTRVSKFAK